MSCHHRGNAEHILFAELDEPAECHTLMGCHCFAFVDHQYLYVSSISIYTYLPIRQTSASGSAPCCQNIPADLSIYAFYIL